MTCEVMNWNVLADLYATEAVTLLLKQHLCNMTEQYGKRHLNRFAMPYGPAGGIRGALSFLNWSQNMVEKCQDTCPSSAKSICYFSVCHRVVKGQPPQHATTVACAPGVAPPAPCARPCCCVLRRLSLGWLLNGKQKNILYSWQRAGMYF